MLSDEIFAEVIDEMQSVESELRGKGYHPNYEDITDIGQKKLIEKILNRKCPKGCTMRDYHEKWPRIANRDLCYHIKVCDEHNYAAIYIHSCTYLQVLYKDNR